MQKVADRPLESKPEGGSKVDPIGSYAIFARYVSRLFRRRTGVPAVLEFVRVDRVKLQVPVESRPGYTEELRSLATVTGCRPQCATNRLNPNGVSVGA